MKKIILATLFALSSPAFAQGYVGVGIGQSSIDIEPIDFGPGVSASVDNTDTTFKIFGGYAFNRNFAVEGGHADLGEARLYYTDGVSSLKEHYEASALYVAALGMLPMGQAVSLFGKLGLASWALDGSISSSTGGFRVGSWSGTDPMFGVGVSFNASRAFMIRAEFERFMDVGDEFDTGTFDIDVLSVSAAMKF